MSFAAWYLVCGSGSSSRTNCCTLVVSIRCDSALWEYTFAAPQHGVMPLRVICVLGEIILQLRNSAHT